MSDEEYDDEIDNEERAFDELLDACESCGGLGVVSDLFGGNQEMCGFCDGSGVQGPE